MMGVYVSYRGLVVEFVRRRARGCGCCNGDWDGESEDEDEGYSAI